MFRHRLHFFNLDHSMSLSSLTLTYYYRMIKSFVQRYDQRFNDSVVSLSIMIVLQLGVPRMLLFYERSISLITDQIDCFASFIACLTRSHC